MKHARKSVCSGGEVQKSSGTRAPVLAVNSMPRRALDETPRRDIDDEVLWTPTSPFSRHSDEKFMNSSASLRIVSRSTVGNIDG
jgi:hypothetical protein